MPEVIAGYEVIRKLGAGGMGDVYLVAHPRLSREDALKVLPAVYGLDTEYAERFRREAAMLASLTHANIVAIYDCGEEDGRLWIAMEYVPGTDAESMIAAQGTMPVPLVSQIVGAAAAALDYAWGEGLAHRDVKPGNLLVQLDAQPQPIIKLADFGLAKSATETDGLTNHGFTMGTVQYLAPELFTGRQADNVSDQYSLACTAFTLLTGHPPYGGNPANVVTAHMKLPFPRVSAAVPGIPPHVDAALARATAKNPADRFPNCTAFADAFAGRTPIAPPPPAIPLAPGAPGTGPQPAVVLPPAVVPPPGPVLPGPVPPGSLPPGSPPLGAGPAAPSGTTRVMLWLAVAFIAVLLAVGVGIIIMQTTSGDDEPRDRDRREEQVELDPPAPADDPGLEFQVVPGEADHDFGEVEARVDAPRAWKILRFTRADGSVAYVVIRSANDPRDSAGRVDAPLGDEPSQQVLLTADPSCTAAATWAERDGFDLPEAGWSQTAVHSTSPLVGLAQRDFIAAYVVGDNCLLATATTVFPDAQKDTYDPSAPGTAGDLLDRITGQDQVVTDIEAGDG